MTSPLTFDSASPRLGLPFLFAGQSQKEIFVNEALALTDALMHCLIEGVANSPPPTVNNGMNWLVGSTPSGEWAGQAGKLACKQAGGWMFVQPVDGMRIVNRATGQIMLFLTTWKTASAIPAPTGGSTVDAEARTAVTQIIAALKASGILSAS